MRLRGEGPRGSFLSRFYSSKCPKMTQNDPLETKGLRMTPGWGQEARCKGRGGLLLGRFYFSKWLTFPVLGHKKVLVNIGIEIATNNHNSDLYLASHTIYHIGWKIMKDYSGWNWWIDWKLFRRRCKYPLKENLKWFPSFGWSQWKVAVLVPTR